MHTKCDCSDELSRLRRLIADAARVIREKGYCELEFDVLVSECYRMDYADLGEWLDDDERYGTAHKIELPSIESRCPHCGGWIDGECECGAFDKLGIPARDDGCVPF